ncbi:hypothetical protein ACU6VG_06640 [Sphaerotilus sulfidivorans]|uniref:hypothetical protein n=1 Tax=Sphaerotilus sp. FB-3 TaxID=2913396 RepID=UPI002042327E|nr:hypothetical protein [Sphaerotilus sp. FB-3]
MSTNLLAMTLPAGMSGLDSVKAPADAPRPSEGSVGIEPAQPAKASTNTDSADTAAGRRKRSDIIVIKGSSSSVRMRATVCRSRSSPILDEQCAAAQCRSP